MESRVLGTFFLASAFALCAVSVPSSAYAEDPWMTKILNDDDTDLSPKGVFDAVDNNGDGKVDRGELRFRKMAVFTFRDKNKDTFLTPQEFDSLSEAVFATLDTDKDNRVSGYEFNQSDLTKFDTIDSDRDNVITFEEFQSFRVHIQE